MKLIKVSEAAEMLGVHRQTLENWGARGIIKIKKSSKDGRAHYVSESVIKQFADTTKEIAATREALNAELAEAKAEYDKVQAEILDIRKELQLHQKIGNSLLMREFCLAIPKVLEDLELISTRSQHIMTLVINGEDCRSIGNRFGISRGRVAQIFYAGCKKALKLADLKKDLEELDTLRLDSAKLKECVRALSEENERRKEIQNKPIDAEGYQMLENKVKMLDVRIKDCGFSLRSTNCLQAADVNTIGELIRYSKAQVLKFRNLGKKSLNELDDYLEINNLEFGTDVDKIYNDYTLLKTCKE